LNQFLQGKAKILITKPKIAGFGMNFQNANTVIFCGLGFSYESYYQCIRRCWRFGQKHPVIVIVVVTSYDKHIVEIVRAKHKEAETLSISLTKQMAIHRKGNSNDTTSR